MASKCGRLRGSGSSTAERIISAGSFHEFRPRSLFASSLKMKRTASLLRSKASAGSAGKRSLSIPDRNTKLQLQHKGAELAFLPYMGRQLRRGAPCRDHPHWRCHTPSGPDEPQDCKTATRSSCVARSRRLVCGENPIYWRCLGPVDTISLALCVIIGTIETPPPTLPEVSVTSRTERDTPAERIPQKDSRRRFLGYEEPRLRHLPPPQNYLR